MSAPAVIACQHGHPRGCVCSRCEDAGCYKSEPEYAAPECVYCGSVEAAHPVIVKVKSGGTYRCVAFAATEEAIQAEEITAVRSVPEFPPTGAELRQLLERARRCEIAEANEARYLRQWQQMQCERDDALHAVAQIKALLGAIDTSAPPPIKPYCASCGSTAGFTTRGLCLKCGGEYFNPPVLLVNAEKKPL